MNVSLFIVFISEIVTFITQTVEAGPSWSWSSRPKHKQWNWRRSYGEHICSEGQCVKAWKCPESSISHSSTGSCFYWRNGPWVCCMENDPSNSESWENRNTYSTQSPRTSESTMNTKKQHLGSSSVNNRDDKVNNHNFWNRNAADRPRSFVDIWDKVTTPRPWHATTKFPHHLPKSTTLRNKRTSVIDTVRTTSSWIKPHTSESRIFPTQTPSYLSTAKWRRSTQRAYTNLPTRRTTRYPGHTIETLTVAPTQSWGHPAVAYPTRAQTKKPSRANKQRPTTKTTKRYQKSTPVSDVNTHLCGVRDQRRQRNVRSDSRGPYERIVGGEEVEPFSWPWVAALYKVSSSGGYRFLSAGSLINENYVLTAAHVFTPDDLRSASYVVMLGTHNAQDAVGEYVVSSVLQHPEYEHRYYYHDIALLKLEKPVALNNYVMPICLPSPTVPLLRDRNLQGKNVTVMGWGDDSFGGKGSRVLKEATFPIVSRISCNASYIRVASNRFPHGITDNMLCAGDPDGRKDACQGDSGGPLTSTENGRYIQVGIVSFGYKCGDKEFPGVYTKVASYLDWITDNAKKKIIY